MPVAFIRAAGSDHLSKNQPEYRRTFLQMSAILYNSMSGNLYKLLSFKQM